MTCIEMRGLCGFLTTFVLRAFSSPALDVSMDVEEAVFELLHYAGHGANSYNFA